MGQQDGRRVLSGGADNAVRMLDIERGPSSVQQVAAHDAPVKAVRWLDAHGGMLVTGSWDKTIKVP
jgi:mRNA export factor